MAKFGRTEILDRKIWEVVCDSFKCDTPFNIRQATDACQKHLPEIGKLTDDYAVGRVYGALRRIDKNSNDIIQGNGQPWFALLSVGIQRRDADG